MKPALLFPFLLSFAQAQIPAVSGEPKELLRMSIIDIEVGTGAPAMAGQRYKVHYTGWLRDGTRFDSSRDRPEPFTFVQGRRQVIAGWEAGFAGMKVGGKRRLIIPYQMAYGDKGSGKVIGPREDLIFDVELLGVEDVPERPAAQDILDDLATIEKKIISMAQSLPEEKFDWRPGAGVRSFGEVFRHIHNDNLVWLSMVARTPSPEETRQLYAENSKSEKQAHTRQETVRDLGESFAALRKAIEPLRSGALGSDVHVFDHDTTRRGVLVMFLTHASEHLGQLIAYERINGIVPPWSK
jgi:peptidylprolyl isomerase/FKBP-type peptidyl-prolyl cis-trans isomerase FkpA